MLYVNKLTSDPQQQVTLTGIPGLQINMTLRFMPRIESWIMGVAFGTQSIQGIRVVTAANFLRQWKNVIPFGMCCLRADGLDPFDVTDFSSQAANLYLLDAADVAALEAKLFA